MHKLLVHLIPPTILPKAKTIERRTCSRQTRTFQAGSYRSFLRGCSYPEGTILPRFCAVSVMATPLPIARRVAYLLGRVTRVVGFSRSACSCVVFNGTICFWALHLELNYFVRVRDVGEVEEVPQCLQRSQSLLLRGLFSLSLFCILNPCSNALHCKITY